PWGLSAPKPLTKGTIVPLESLHLQTESDCKLAATFCLQKLSSLFLSSLRRKKWGAGQRPAVLVFVCRQKATTIL
ncbi:MAG: hypothetical protein LBM16_05165, partial [Clostridiales bacterium]|nr:hypothetical protein [Clostridiales bacterium]